MTMKRVLLADLKVGDEAEIVESYPDALFTFRGKVVAFDGVTARIGSWAYARQVFARMADRQVLQVDVKQEDPPAVRAAVVKYYNPVYLQTRVAHHDGETGWYDLDTGGPVELDGTDWTVLFDPRKEG